MNVTTKFIAASVFVLLFALSLLPAGAQEPLSITVDNMDTAQFPGVTTQVVVQENGLSRHGLTKDNFTIFEDNNSTATVLEQVEEVSSSQRPCSFFGI